MMSRGHSHFPSHTNSAPDQSHASPRDNMNHARNLSRILSKSSNAQVRVLKLIIARRTDSYHISIKVQSQALFYRSIIFLPKKSSLEQQTMFFINPEPPLLPLIGNTIRIYGSYLLLRLCAFLAWRFLVLEHEPLSMAFAGLYFILLYFLVG